MIDDVALNYSANHEGEEMPSSSSSAANADKRKATATPSTTWTDSGEITIKSFAKISTNTPQNQQRARKSFPTPSASKTFGMKQTQMSVFKKDNNVSSQAGISSPSNVSSKETSSANNSSTSNSSSAHHNVMQISTTHNLVQTSTITSSYTSQITTSTNTTTTTHITSSASSSPYNSVMLRTVPSQSTLTTCSATLMVNNSTALTVGANPTVSLSSISSCSLQTRPHEGAVPHVILFPNPTMNYGSPIVSPMIGMVSRYKLLFLLVFYKVC